MSKKTIWFVVSISFAVCGYTNVNADDNGNSIQNSYFRIQIVDEQTGRGIPLVELEATNLIRLVTDSNGVVAFYEPGLMGQKVYFHIKSHGYEYPKDGFGYRGKAFDITPGGSTIVKMKRLNIAERLYRVTGQGIYRDSLMTGQAAPLKNPAVNGLVMGQDSVQTCFYRNRLYWFWGDTARPSYPLGHFATAGAVTLLPEQGGLDPSLGVDLDYFVDKTGFSKKMFPVPERGMIWIDGVITATDPSGRERLLTMYARLITMAEVKERGIGVYNDTTETFERLVHSGPDFLAYHSVGHPISIQRADEPYYYFATPFPVAARLRVKASWDHIIDPDQYEVFTALQYRKKRNLLSQNSYIKGPSSYRWILTKELLPDDSQKAALIKALEEEKKSDSNLYDMETGKAVLPHGGTVYWNSYRRKWIMITVQQFGGPSFLGEVWYAEADTPLGPWGYARRIATHEKYSFYNPKYHPYFDQDKGRVIYFEGTYSHTFSGSKEAATPYYDYNQIMYRLDLEDERLNLPVPTYQLRSRKGDINYQLGEEVARQELGEQIESVPFFAIPPERKYKGLIPIYRRKIKAGEREVISLHTQAPSQNSVPLFYALPITGDTIPSDISMITFLFEYRNSETSFRLYSIQEDLQQEGWIRSETPLCCVWKNPDARKNIYDWLAKPLEIGENAE
jgi:hypothetical protein